MLTSSTQNLPLSSDVQLEILAKQCLGYVAADLTALVRQSIINTLTATSENPAPGDYMTISYVLSFLLFNTSQCFARFLCLHSL